MTYYIVSKLDGQVAVENGPQKHESLASAEGALAAYGYTKNGEVYSNNKPLPGFFANQSRPDLKIVVEEI